MPIDPAKDTKAVLPFLVKRFLPERDNAVQKDIEVFFSLVVLGFSSTKLVLGASLTLNSLESFIILPSSNSTILVEYLLANSGLWVTMMMSFSLEISFNSSIT